jgi:uncharacterized protein YsxB (DUF464 family)
MIKVSKHDEGINIEGHAGYAPHGQDIVCAAVSILCQTLIQSINDLTMDSVECAVESGNVNIKYRILSEKAQLLIESFFVGIEMLANNYPEHVQMTRHERL